MLSLFHPPNPFCDSRDVVFPCPEIFNPQTKFDLGRGDILSSGVLILVCYKIGLDRLTPRITRLPHLSNDGLIDLDEWAEI
jgi:hypothetical protein